MSDVTNADVVEATVEPDEAVAEDAQEKGALDVRAAVSGMNDRGSDSFSTFSVETGAQKLALLKAISTSTPIDEMLNTVINIDNFQIQVVEITDSNSGELILAPRATIFDADGKAYHGTSKGLLTALRNLNNTLGDRSTWEGPVAAKVIYGGKAPRRYFTLEFI